MRKRPYLLLELLIALTLAILFALPLIRTPLSSLHEETSSLVRMELERRAEVDFSDLKEKFYKNTIPWTDTKKGESHTILNDTVTLELPNISEQEFQRLITVAGKGEQEGKNDEIHRLVEVNIIFVPKNNKLLKKSTFTHKLFLTNKKKKID